MFVGGIGPVVHSVAPVAECGRSQRLQSKRPAAKQQQIHDLVDN